MTKEISFFLVGFIIGYILMYAIAVNGNIISKEDSSYYKCIGMYSIAEDILQCQYILEEANFAK